MTVAGGYETQGWSSRSSLVLVLLAAGHVLMLAFEFLNPLLGPGQDVLASADKAHPLLVFRDRLLKTDIPGLNPFNDLLKPLQGLLEGGLVVGTGFGWLWAVGVAFGGHDGR